MPKVLITGISGFLGSHIAHALLNKGFTIIGLKRSTSDIWRCKDIEYNIEWVDIDLNEHWKTTIVELKPTMIIHSAWIGVSANERDNWGLQIKNINFLFDILDIGRRCKTHKILFLGSQAEYGIVDGKILESSPVKSVSAYGAVKLACLEIYQSFCEQHNINWIWLRVFSVFGELEDKTWLIPSVIHKMQVDHEMDFTKGEQKYAYMYVKDLAAIITKILQCNIRSDIYNVSSNEVHQLRYLLEFIKNEVNSGFKLHFGRLPYRLNQSMHIEGDMSKLISQIGKIEFTNFKVALHNTIKHYILK
jgi:nucleoside-diphosphate-sugar epimerase